MEVQECGLTLKNVLQILIFQSGSFAPTGSVDNWCICQKEWSLGGGRCTPYDKPL